jgi:hypothetical protein
MISIFGQQREISLRPKLIAVKWEKEKEFSSQIAFDSFE